MAEKIILEWVGDPSGLKPVADALKSLGKLTKEQEQQFNAANKAFQKRTAESKKATEESRKLNQETAKGKKSIEGMADASKKLPANIKQAGVATQTLGKGMANLGRQIASAFGIVTVVATLISTIKSAVSISADFEQQMSKVKAVTGATASEMQRLENDAKRLGSSTKFTATQVGELQENYAKLGFTTNEILKATEATLQLAQATGSDLATSADVAGAVVRGFGLDASETQRVVDVMAKSFSSSALSMDNFSEAMKYVAPIAKAANVDVETTTALLGRLADAGLRGSMAGTGLKNLLSKLSDASSDLSKELGFSVKNSNDVVRAFKELAKGNIDLTKATELTDERSKAAFLTLIGGIESVDDLRDALYGAGGAAKEMADIMSDNFKGDVDRAASAWEGLMLTIEETDTARAAIQILTDVVGGLDIVIQKLKGTWQGLQEERGLEEAFKRGEQRAQKFNTTMSAAISDQPKLIKTLEKEIERASQTYDELNGEAEKWNVINEKYKKEIGDYSWFQVVPESTEKAAAAASANSMAINENQESLLAYMDALQVYIDKMKKAGDGAGGGATDKFVYSLETLSKQLKTIKGDFETAEIGSAAWIAKLKEMELKNREIAKAQKLAATTLKEYREELDMMSSAEQYIKDQDFSKALFGEYERNKNEMLKKGEDAINKLAALETIRVNDDIENEKTRKDTLFDIETARIDGMIALREKLGMDTTDLEAQQSARLRGLKDDETKHFEDSEKKKQAAAKKTAEEATKEFKAAVEQSGQIAIQLFNGITEIQNNALEYEMQQLELQLERGEITREQYEERRRSAQIKQANNNKQASLFNAIINTAVAVTKALAEENFALAIVAGVLGGIEIAAIASQPIPQFAVGTKDAPAGYKWVGEKGAELIYDGGGYPIITHAESTKLAQDPHSDAAKSIRKKYGIPEMDIGLFGNSNAFQYSDAVRNADTSRSGIDYDALADAIGRRLLGNDRNMLRSLQQSRQLDADGYSAIIDALGNMKPKRRGYAN